MTTTPDNPDDQPTQAVPPRDRANASYGDDDSTLAVGTMIGHYRVLELLGTGGMGAVYRAEQLEPVHRLVALKLMSEQRVDARHLAHFEVERQVLARMQHPGIAQIFDAGTTDDGAPYFIMELIEGQPITAYCEREKLSLSARMALLVQVCEAVQHAHHKGVIHRDLKPGNILVAEVDGRPAAKIIDFGIATAAQRSRSSSTEEIAGTPDYMSPEQSRGVLDIDARSDVYALGVLMYELLTGRRPAATTGFEPASTGVNTTLRPPSQLLADDPAAEIARLASSRGVSSDALRLELRRDLDWVVLKALQHDRDDRFATPLELADELRRWSEGLPLRSVPASRSYLLGKLVRRHRLALGAAAAVLGSLIVGTGLLAYGLVEARQQREVAQQRQGELERVARFQSAMLEGIDIEAMAASMQRLQRDGIGEAGDDALAMLDEFDRLSTHWSGAEIARRLVDSQLLKNAVVAVNRDFSDQPLLAAELLYSLTDVYFRIGLYAEAEATGQMLVALRTQHLGASDPLTLKGVALLASAINRQGKFAEAKVLLDEAADNMKSLDPNSDAVVAVELAAAVNQDDRGEREEAVRTLEALRERLLPVRPADDPALNKATNNLAITLARLGRHREARPLLESLLPTRIESLGAENPDTLSTMAVLAIVRSMDGEIDQALLLQTELLAIYRRRLGDLHPVTLSEVNNLGSTLLRLNRHDEARVLLEEGLRSRQKVLGPGHPQTLRSMNNLASLLNITGDSAGALAMQQEAVKARESSLGRDHPDTVRASLNIAGMQRDLGQLEEAAATAADALARMRATQEPDSLDIQSALGAVADIAEQRGQIDAAEAAMREQYESRQRSRGADDPLTLRTGLSLYQLLSRNGRDASAMLDDVRALAKLDPEGLDSQAKEDQTTAIGIVAERGEQRPSKSRDRGS